MLLRFFVTSALISLAAADCTRNYTVQKGDYCDKISAAQKVSTYQLQTVNKITDGCTHLLPGQSLCLGYKGEDCQDVYTVVKGDICEEIAADHKVNITTLYSNNPQIDKKNCSNIYVGEVLCVANTVIVKNPLSTPIPIITPPATPTPPPTTPTTSPAKPSQSPASQPDVKAQVPDTGSNGDDDDDDSDLPYCDE